MQNVHERFTLYNNVASLVFIEISKKCIIPQEMYKVYYAF